jgi:hypothetical protein
VADGDRAKTPVVSDDEPRRRGLRIDPSDLLLEIVSIVIGVILALAASQAVESSREAQRTHEALMQIRQEIVQDETDLHAVHPLHRRVEAAFERAVARARDRHLDFADMYHTFGDAAPRGFNPFGGTTTAWDLARGSDVLADVPYGVRAALQTRYGELQNLNSLNDMMIARLEIPTTDEHPNFYFAAFDLRLMLDDIDFSEERLMRDDRAALDALASDGVRG